MKYDFSGSFCRTDMGAEKEYATPESFRQKGIFPLCYAEMDYPTAPVIRDALRKRAESGVHPYTLSDDKVYLDIVQRWISHRRGWETDRDWIVPCYGVTSTLVSCLRAFTAEREGVIIQPPVFHNYRKLITLNNRRVVNNPLLLQGTEYVMNMKQLEELMSAPDNRMLILCHPHNPINQIWPQKTLEQIAYLSKKYQVLVLSDEVFAEQAFDHKAVISYGSIPEGREWAIVCTSVSKAFNLCGGKHGNNIIPSSRIRDLYVMQRNADCYASMDPFFYEAVLAAYTEEGEAWLDASIDYVAENVRILQTFFKEVLPQVICHTPQAGFFAWVNWKGLGMEEDALHEFLRNKAYLLSDKGSRFGKEGECFSRVILGTPHENLERILQYLKNAVYKN